MPTITLPLPPSVNRLWRAGRRRVYRSRQYEAWRTEAGWTLNTSARRASPATCKSPLQLDAPTSASAM
jgi:Holliday junction resolvase RusA-like endonuclease